MLAKISQSRSPTRAFYCMKLTWNWNASAIIIKDGWLYAMITNLSTKLRRWFVYSFSTDSSNQPVTASGRLLSRYNTWTWGYSEARVWCSYSCLQPFWIPRTYVSYATTATTLSTMTARLENADGSVNGSLLTHNGSAQSKTWILQSN